MNFECYFFDEFDNRFNTVAIDYLTCPHEVFTNLRESYPLPLIISAQASHGWGFQNALRHGKSTGVSLFQIADDLYTHRWYRLAN